MEQLSLGLSNQEEGARLFEEVHALPRLELAFKKVRANGGSAGPDGVSVEQFEEQLSDNVSQLEAELKSRSYQPGPVRRVSIPKPNSPSGGERHLGIANVRDRVVQQSILMALNPYFDPRFSKSSYGFREGRSQRGAIEAARSHVANGKEWVVDLDLEKFFDTVNHDRVLHLIREKVSDRRLLKVIALTLRSGVEIDGKVEKSTIGLPQGSPLSPLLSNVVLDRLDKELEKRGLDFVRYADDANIFVGSQKAAERILASVTKYIEQKLKLRVNRDKSQTALSKTVKFLGMTMLAGGLAMISIGAMKKAKEKVKELIPRSGRGSIETQVERVNLWYQGWSGYYAMTNYPSQLKQIEANIRMRFRLQFIKNHKRKKHLVRKLVKQGARRGTAYRAVYLKNSGRWKLAHDFTVNLAWSEAWFRQRGLKTRSKTEQLHWQPLKAYPQPV
jgi:RNA-directed DNA polymerase